MSEEADKEIEKGAMLTRTVGLKRLELESLELDLKIKVAKENLERRA
ncbi:hypothetical protein KAT21_05425 [Candidatus Bathyarchaeota archaeon]|nr:hypothetical protein [Candidatus Bathyarchaeota archaeon]